MRSTKLSTTQTSNPFTAPKEEQLPARIWELLRRNKAFRQSVQELHRLDRLSAKERCAARQPARDAARSLIENLRPAHPFAACALEWLVPEPLFVVREVVVPAAAIAMGRTVAPLEVVRVGEGTTPDMKDTSRWRWFPSDRAANLAGRKAVRGPEVRWQTSQNPRLADERNAIEEYHHYAQTHGRFTTKDAWASAPPGFKRAFQRIWASVDGRTGTRPAHQVSFLGGVKVGDFADGTAGGITQVAMATALKIRKLDKDYHVFAVPRGLRTKGAVRAVFRKLAEDMAATLPDEHAMLGTPRQWEDFLAVEAAMKRLRCPRTPAIHRLLMDHYAGTRTLTQVRQASEADVTGRVAAIENLRDSIFPVLDLPVILTPAVHRRSTRPRKSS